MMHVCGRFIIQASFGAAVIVSLLALLSGMKCLVRPEAAL